MSAPGILIVAPPPLRTAAGEMTEKFGGGERRCVGVADAFRAVAAETDCAFFDAGTIAHVSEVDGVHLDADQHCLLAAALAPIVAKLLR
jgi:hypothetical protein